MCSHKEQEMVLFFMLQPRYVHKNIRIRTKPLRPELRAPKDKNKKGLDGPPIMSLMSSSSS